jgi:hypothetical protein
MWPVARNNRAMKVFAFAIRPVGLNPLFVKGNNFIELPAGLAWTEVANSPIESRTGGGIEPR